MSKRHDLKTEAEYYRAVAAGLKNFELRKNDRDFKVGDTLVLKETVDGKYTFNEIEKEVAYILEGGKFGLQEGYVIMGLKPADWPQ